jgi:hypothetical protein
MKIFGREPALWLAAIAAVVSLGSQFLWHLSDEQQSVINAVALALVGILTGVMVDEEKLAPAILGFISALLSLAMGFGWHLDPQSQSVIMTAAAGIVAMFVRTQVTVDSAPLTYDETVEAELA